MNINNRTFWSSLKVPGTTVSVRPAPRSPYTVLKVASLIDPGIKRAAIQTAVLENAFPGLEEEDIELIKVAQKISHSKMSIPPKIAHLNCVFTGRRPRLVRNAYVALKEMAGVSNMIPVIPDIIAPGDYVIFRHLPNRACFKFSGMVRAVPNTVVPSRKQY